MSDQYQMMCQQTCQEYAEKSHVQTLNEEEALLYMQLCRTARRYARVQELCLEAQELQCEKEIYEYRKAHEKWLEERCPPPEEP